MAKYYTQSVQETLKSLETDPESGLSSELYQKRKKKHGPNRLRETQKTSKLIILINQFKSIVILVLLAAAILAFSLQHMAEGLAVTAVLMVNTLIGFYTEFKAIRTMESLRQIHKMRTLFTAIMPLKPVNKGPKGIEYQIQYEKLAEKYPNWSNANKYKTVNSVNQKPKKKSKSREEQREIFQDLLASGEVKNQADIARKFEVSRAWVSKVLS